MHARSRSCARSMPCTAATKPGSREWKAPFTDFREGSVAPRTPRPGRARSTLLSTSSSRNASMTFTGSRMPRTARANLAEVLGIHRRQERLRHEGPAPADRPCLTPSDPAFLMRRDVRERPGDGFQDELEKHFCAPVAGVPAEYPLARHLRLREVFLEVQHAEKLVCRGCRLGWRHRPGRLQGREIGGQSPGTEPFSLAGGRRVPDPVARRVLHDLLRHPRLVRAELRGRLKRHRENRAEVDHQRGDSLRLTGGPVGQCGPGVRPRDDPERSRAARWPRVGPNLPGTAFHDLPGRSKSRSGG